MGVLDRLLWGHYENEPDGETAPDGGGAAASEPAAPSSSSSEPSPAASQPVASTPAPPSTSPPEQWNDIRDYARAQGLDLSHIQDSEQAARYLIEQARNNSAYSQWGQQLAPYYSEIQQYLAQRNRPQAPTTPQQPNYFGLPEFNPQWLDWLERDAAGNVVPKIGAPPDVVGKVVQYQRALQDFQNKFWQKPQEHLTPLVRDAVAPLVHQAIQGQLRQYQDQVYATNLVAQNSQWMHYRDQQGQVIRDPITGGYAMTPEGQLYVAQLKRAQSMGVSGLQNQHAYAMDQMRLAYYAQQQNQAQAVAGAATQDQQFLQQHNRRAPNSGGSLGTGASPTQDNSQLSLYDRLQRDLQQNGITDQMLRAES